MPPSSSDTRARSRHSLPRLRARGDTPEITIVVASNGGQDPLFRCLAVLAPQCSRGSAELVVARAATLPELTVLRASFPTVHWVAASPSTPIQQLRALGMSEATGHIVVFTADFLSPDETLVDTLLWRARKSADAGRDRSSDAGAVRALDEATFLEERSATHSARVTA